MEQSEFNDDELTFYVATTQNETDPLSIIDTIHSIGVGKEREFTMRPYFSEAHQPAEKEHRHSVDMIQFDDTKEIYIKNVAVEEGKQISLSTWGIADCMALGIVEVNDTHKTATRMSIVHFKSGDYERESMNTYYFNKLLEHMNHVNVYAVIASSRMNQWITGRGQYRDIASELVKRGVRKNQILCYLGTHNTSIHLIISSNLTFGEFKSEK